MSEAVTPLRAYRQSQQPRMPLRVLADKVGVTPGQLSRIERGGATSLRTALKIAEVTNLPVELFGTEKAA